MRKHDIIMQCKVVRLNGDLSDNPKLYEVSKWVNGVIGKRTIRQYICRRIENDKQITICRSIDEIEPIPYQRDIDLLKDRQKRLSEMWKGILPD